MATVVKIAAFAALFKITHICFGMNDVFWSSLIAIVAALTITIGNVTAIFQTNFKRVLAYSSISHAGYLLLAVLSTSAAETSVFNLAFYLASYSIATVCTFAIFMRVKEAAGGNQGFEIFNGLGKQQPFTAALLAICLLSMAGIPPMAGFFAKYYLFADAFANYAWLVIIAILNSAISIYYYFRPIIHMYFTETKDVPAAAMTIPAGFKAVIFISVITAIGLGIVSGWINVFTTQNTMVP
jgi:NADH-quinone oxidoreductase subunit N